MLSPMEAIQDYQKEQQRLTFSRKGELLVYLGQLDSHKRPHGLGVLLEKRKQDKSNDSTVRNSTASKLFEDRVEKGDGYIYNTIYEGEWREGKREGQGFERFADGVSIYHGDFKRDRPHGKGLYMNAVTGDRYTGEWYQGMKHGTGIWDRKNARVEVQPVTKTPSGVISINTKSAFKKQNSPRKQNAP